ncbi:hypothetical protein AB0K08_08930 [Citricoccus sp. NPDC055426]|uniref:hypothetical protein n=1 Tax=Citricoccus sp. NPDC055426 TaxID=3155536 RepID=UPI003433F327
MSAPQPSPSAEAVRARSVCARVLLFLAGLLWFLLAAFADLPAQLAWLPTREYDAGQAGEA